jgi:hypothetical protein
MIPRSRSKAVPSAPEDDCSADPKSNVESQEPVIYIHPHSDKVWGEAEGTKS